MLRIGVARIADMSAAFGDGPPAWLGPCERRRWVDLSAVGRRGFASSRDLLRGLLEESTSVPRDAWDVSARAGEAPVARSPGHDALHASLSHRLAWVAAAVADTPVGIDVECERPARSDPGERAFLMLAPAELAAWQALPALEREAALLTRWTAKEAWFKAMPAQAAPWDFRHIVARPCAAAIANVRTWTASPLHVALCSFDAQALAAADCAGLASASDCFWRVDRAPSVT